MHVTSSRGSRGLSPTGPRLNTSGNIKKPWSKFIGRIFERPRSDVGRKNFDLRLGCTRIRISAFSRSRNVHASSMHVGNVGDNEVPVSPTCRSDRFPCGTRDDRLRSIKLTDARDALHIASHPSTPVQAVQFLLDRGSAICRFCHAFLFSNAIARQIRY